jgi:hypothetical protein
MVKRGGIRASILCGSVFVLQLKSVLITGLHTKEGFNMISLPSAETVELALDILVEAEVVQVFEDDVWVKIPRDLWEEFTGEEL